MADSYYTVIKGKKYDRRMLELADGLTSGRGDGRISVNDAKTLLRTVKDSNSYSPTEKATMEYIRKHYKFTKEGDEYFRSEIRKWAAGKGKKKAPAKTKKVVEKPVAAEAPAPAYEAPAYSAPAAVSAEKKSSPWKQILIALLLLALITAAFYFFAYRSSCAKPAATSTPVTEVKPAAAPVVEAAKVPEVPPAKTVAPVSEELKSFVEKSKIIFIPEKSEITPAGAKTLDALAARLKGENLKLQITGHACALGSKEINQQISEKRANVVKAALVSRGVPAGQIETRGVGESETIGDQKTVAGRVASRRVTFKVLQ